MLKAVTYCGGSEADLATIVSALRGHFVSLGTNVIGARCCESIIQLFPKKLSRGLKAEFYGKVTCPAASKQAAPAKCFVLFGCAFISLM